MSMQTITASNFTQPQRLVPTLANSIAMMGAPREPEVKSPSVSVTTFYSFQNLSEIMKMLDTRFGRHLGVAVELPVHFAPDWHRLRRTAAKGGQLAVVVPPQSRITLPMSTAQGEDLHITGWDNARRYVTIDHAIEDLLSGDVTLERCFILRPEWHDPTAVFSAIGRSIVTCR